jgi:peptidoglycan/LPS O-acetylase OafA/YrhL
VVVLSSIGLGLLVYALVDSPGRYPGDRRKQSQFVIGWLFTIPALVVRFTTL